MKAMHISSSNNRFVPPAIALSNSIRTEEKGKVLYRQLSLKQLAGLVEIRQVASDSRPAIAEMAAIHRIGTDQRPARKGVS